MLDLSQYSSLGAALRDALDRWPNETCLIEADRDREKVRLTYSEFKHAALPLAKALQSFGVAAGSRCAIIMTNQSKWLVSAYAALYTGAVLVPLDYKLTASEQLALLAHSEAEVLVTEYHLWRAMMQAPEFVDFAHRTVLVTESPKSAELGIAKRWEEFQPDGAAAMATTGEPTFVPRQRSDWACIVYSSGTGGRPKGCVLTHENYLEQCVALTSLYPFWPGVRYLSILPTNHAIDFMVGFIGPFTCGACVVHLRTLRPEFVREAFSKYKITYMAVVPMVLKNLERGLRQRFDELPRAKRLMFEMLRGINETFTRKKPRLGLSRKLLGQVHEAFGGELRALFVGGAFMEPATLQFFYDLGIQVSNGYGLTEAGTAVTLNDFTPFRSDTVGRPLPGMEVRIANAGTDGIGEVAIRSKTLMSHYLKDPELTAETIVKGWLMTGDLGCFDATGHLQLMGRKKNMIVTEGGKNIYPEDIEAVFDGLPVKEYAVLAANYVWPRGSLGGKEMLLLVLHLENGETTIPKLVAEIHERNRKLPDFKRVSGYVVWEQDFPRTASMKVKRQVLAEELAAGTSREAIQEI